jgi:transcription antitermination protein NusB
MSEDEVISEEFEEFPEDAGDYSLDYYEEGYDVRHRALAVFYEAESKTLSGSEILTTLPTPAPKRVADLVLGVDEHKERIDSLIREHARGWTLERMPIIDRNVLRLAIFELLQGTLPKAVIINEAVELAKNYSTDESGKFVNGMLSKISKHLGSK